MTHVNFAMTTLLNGIWQGTILAVAMWVLLKLLPRLNPTTRFTVLWLTLLAVVALPIGPCRPELSIPGAQTDSPAIATTNTPASYDSRTRRFRSRNLVAESAANPESHRVSIPNRTPSSVSEQASESVQAQNAASRIHRL